MKELWHHKMYMLSTIMIIMIINNNNIVVVVVGGEPTMSVLFLPKLFVIDSKIYCFGY